MKKPKKADVELLESWKGVPEGTLVIVSKDDGIDFHTQTRSAAWMLGGHTPVIMVNGISGGYLLSRVRKA